MFYTYQIFNNLNGKSYIGKTNNIKERFKQHIRIVKGGKLKYPRVYYTIHYAIEKYGIENFSFIEIQKYDSEQDAYLGETYWINFFDTVKNGYNSSIGGFGSPSGINSHNFGLKRNKETLKKLSESHKGTRNSLAYLNEDIVRNIKLDRLNYNLTYKELKEKYNVKSVSTVRAIIKEHSWKDIKIK